MSHKRVGGESYGRGANPHRGTCLKGNAMLSTTSSFTCARVGRGQDRGGEGEGVIYLGVLCKKCREIVDYSDELCPVKRSEDMYPL
jgi:hypothetical protein